MRTSEMFSLETYGGMSSLVEMVTRSLLVMGAEPLYQVNCGMGREYAMQERTAVWLMSTATFLLSVSISGGTGGNNGKIVESIN